MLKNILHFYIEYIFLLKKILRLQIYKIIETFYIFVEKIFFQLSSFFRKISQWTCISAVRSNLYRLLLFFSTKFVPLHFHLKESFTIVYI